MRRDCKAEKYLNYTWKNWIWKSNSQFLYFFLDNTITSSYIKNMRTAIIQIKTESDTKEKCAKLFEALGINISDAVNIVFKAVSFAWRFAVWSSYATAKQIHTRSRRWSPRPNQIWWKRHKRCSKFFRRTWFSGGIMWEQEHIAICFRIAKQLSSEKNPL